MTTEGERSGVIESRSAASVHIDQQDSPRTCQQKISRIGRLCGSRLAWVLYRFLSDCLVCRFISCIFTLQAGIMWLGFALNFILQLLFLPFGEHRARTFVASYLMVPGTVAFSAHYFWYIVQTACHVFRRDLSPVDSAERRIPEVSDFLLILINSHMGAKRAYRIAVTIITIIYMISNFSKDSWDMFIVPAGQVPLALMWSLNVTHLLGMLCFVFISCCDCARYRLLSSKPSIVNQHDTITPYSQSFPLTVLVIFIQMIVPYTFQILAIFHHIVWFVLFILWLLIFGRTWPPEEKHCAHLCLCCCVRSSKTNRLSDKRSKRLITYKKFILFVLSAMVTSLAFVLRSSIDLSRAEKISAIFVLCLAGVFEALLMIPPYLDLKCSVIAVIKIQIFIINILMMVASILVLVGVGLLLRNPNPINQWMVIACLVPPLIYLLLLFIYYLYHTIYDCFHRYNNYVSGLSMWIESHHEISIFRNAFYVIFAVMVVIGFSGLALCSSVFFHDETIADNRTLFGEMLLEQDQGGVSILQGKERSISSNETVQSKGRMEACNWQFDSLNIQDMVLLAALAYRPTAKVQTELKNFYGNSSDIQFQVDESLSHFKEYGYGDVTYFTATTADTVIVSIRGTKLPYEWLIDFDTWTESFIYQITSMLFPWSKLFPETLTSRIIYHMASLKRLIHRSDESKRFYVIQMIKILEKIHKKYKNQRAFIVLGHSLGGGLAKLSGIALNFTDVLISVSGPGITHAHGTVDRTKDISMQSINRRVFNIYHDRDLVPWIDKQEGLIQIITCPIEFKRLQCHSIMPLFCHVIQICGNPRNFKINSDICKP